MTASRSSPKEQVLICEILVSTTGILKATLGSCVGIALFSRKPRICGLAHCLLPMAPPGKETQDARYANQAVRNLMRAMGVAAKPSRNLTAYLSGGANVLHLPQHPGRKHIGELNLEACKAELYQLGIHLEEIETGGELACNMLVDCVAQTVTSSRILSFPESPLEQS
ncbi:chemotaxis protein CheD [Bryobacter aggregatus]|uniref:chemotaxis protein CheD n=1 Tax=Bryobacter aggregatus TaxID=360054 RepID=UPI00068C30E5|nr:chemotaxis protein CheD [Bryobacter aggregatus]